MSPFFIILFGLWTYPLFSYIFFLLTKRKPELRKRFLKFTFLLSSLAIVGLLFKVSTTSSIFDWLLISTIYLSVSLGLVWTQFQKRSLLKILGLVFLIIVFGLGYLSSSIGALGVGFIIGDYETEYEETIGKGLIYKEVILGTAVSDYRGKRVELYRTINALPIIEWKILQKESNEYGAIINTPLTVNYKPESRMILLSSSYWSEAERTNIYWSDTLRIDNR